MEVPIYYSVKRGLEPEDIKQVQDALSITPCHAAFIESQLEYSYALNFAEQVIVVNENSITTAEEWARKIGRPMLVLGCSEKLEAIYENGTIETCLKAD